MNREHILFISDLHLDPKRPHVTAAVQEFLATKGQECEKLFLLGDIFELWLGDDDSSELSLAIAAALRKLASDGVRIFMMRGNRDFLLGDVYANQCGAELLGDTYRLETSLGAIELLHGDTLCTDDHDYQEFRTLTREPSWLANFLNQPLEARRAFAETARTRSKEATAKKSDLIMDVNSDAVLKIFKDSGSAFIIHGHTHRPAKHTSILGPGTGTRVVLGDWDKKGWYAEIKNEDLTLSSFLI
jgi:UDP-2,3-diacylglucosamine hydrolase